MQTTDTRATVTAAERHPKPMREIPPLESGDHLSQREFERRYAGMTDIKKADLVEGVVYMSSPVSANHSDAHSQIMGWLVVYRASTPGVLTGDNATVLLDPDNEVQPDALLRLHERHGGKSHISEDDYIIGAPELVVEVAVTSASIDLHDKLRVYRRNGVQEYIVWQTYDAQMSWFRLRDGEYERLSPDEQGSIRSQVFPGLQLNVTSLLDGDLAKVLADLQSGIASAEHTAFVQRLTTASG